MPQGLRFLKPYCYPWKTILFCSNLTYVCHSMFSPNPYLVSLTLLLSFCEGSHDFCRDSSLDIPLCLWDTIWEIYSDCLVGTFTLYMFVLYVFVSPQVARFLRQGLPFCMSIPNPNPSLIFLLLNTRLLLLLQVSKSPKVEHPVDCVVTSSAPKT